MRRLASYLVFPVVLGGGLALAVFGLGAKWSPVLVIAELGQYWMHRWMHEKPLLWRLHAVHHPAHDRPSQRLNGHTPAVARC